MGWADPRYPRKRRRDVSAPLYRSAKSTAARTGCQSSTRRRAAARRVVM